MKRTHSLIDIYWRKILAAQNFEKIFYPFINLLQYL